MTLRPLLVSLPLLLAGCSSTSGFHWSSLSPFNWFGSSLTVGANGVGEINAGTPMNESQLSSALQDKYRLRGGMGTDNGQIVSYYQALDGDDIKMVITGPNKGAVERVVVLDENVASEWGVKIGTPFSDLYSKAYGACVQGQGDDVGSVQCASPQSPQVSYLFSGKWPGPQNLMPSDDTLKSWTVSKIIWHAPK